MLGHNVSIKGIVIDRKNTDRVVVDLYLLEILKVSWILLDITKIFMIGFLLLLLHLEH